MCGNLRGIQFKDCQCHICKKKVKLNCDMSKVRIKVKNMGKKRKKSKKKSPMVEVDIYVRNDYVTTMAVNLDWGVNYIVKSAKDFLSPEDYYLDAFAGEFDRKLLKVVFELKANIEARKKMTHQVKKIENVKYPCPVCQMELKQSDGSGVRTTGKTLYCANLECPVEEIHGYGEDLEHAYKIITDKFKSGNKEDSKPIEQSLEETKETRVIEEKEEIIYANYKDGKVVFDEGSKLCYD